MYLCECVSRNHHGGTLFFFHPKRPYLPESNGRFLKGTQDRNEKKKTKQNNIQLVHWISRHWLVNTHYLYFLINNYLLFIKKKLILHIHIASMLWQLVLVILCWINFFFRLFVCLKLCSYCIDTNQKWIFSTKLTGAYVRMEMKWFKAIHIIVQFNQLQSYTRHDTSSWSQR